MDTTPDTDRIAGRYQLLRLLGAGATGETWLVADQMEMNVERALKWIRADDAGAGASEATRAAVAGEFQILSDLEYPHLTRVFDFGYDETRRAWFLVEEASDGQPMIEAIERAATRTSHPVLDVARQLLATLAFLHERGIVHGDIQPANVLVEERSGGLHLRLIDFSGAIARWLPAPPATGTPGYVAPERIAGGPPSPATDLYAAGALLAQALEAASRAEATNPALRDLCDGLRQRDPTLRLTSARDAARIVGESEPARGARQAPGTAVISQAPLFGRDRELSLARTHLALDVEAGPLGHARLVVADGPVGIGKTRFLQELETRARMAGLRVSHAPTTRGAGDADASTIVVLDPLPHPLSPAGRALRAALGAGGGAPSNGVTSNGVTTRAPTRFAGSPGSEADARSWRSCLAEELSSQTVLWLDLDALDEPACEALAGWVSPSTDTASSRASLARRSGGNPLLLIELANARATGRDLPERGRGVTALTDRIHALPEAARACLAALGLLDGSATAHEIGLLIGAPADDVHVRLRGLAANGLAVAAANGEPRWSAAHGLAAEAALATLGESDRAVWHQRAAEARERGLLPADPIAIARDWLRGHEPRRAVDALHAGWDAVIRDGRLHGAAPLLVEAVDALPAAVIDVDRWLFLARGLELAGEPEAALECLTRAEHAPCASGALPAVSIAISRSTALKALGRIPDAARVLEQLPSSDAAQPGVVELRMRLATLAGRPQEALATARAESGGEDGPMNPALRVQAGYAHWMMGRADAAHDAFQRALAALDPADREARATRALAANGLGILAMQASDHATAARRFAEAVADAEGASSARERASFRLNLASARHGRGELLEALAEYTEAAEELRAAGAWRELAHALANRASLLAFLGDLEAASALAGEACAVLPSSADARAAVVPWLAAAECAREDGRLAEAERHARAVIERHPPRTRETVLAHLVIADVKRRNGDGGAALTTLGEVLKQAAGLDASELLARAFLARGRIGSRSRAEREADLRLAITTFTEIGERIGRAESMLTLVALLEESGDTAGQAPELRSAAHQAIREQARLIPDRYRPLFLRSRGFDVQALEAHDPTRAIGSSEQRDPAQAAARSRELRSANRTLLDTRIMRVLDINRRLASERDRQRLLERILDSAIELTEAERGFLVVRDGDTLDVAVARNLDRETLNRPGKLISRTIADQVLASGESFYSPEAMEDARLTSSGSVRDLRVRSVLCVPCRGDKGVGAALYLDHRFWADAFGADDRVLVEAIADQAAIALENLRLAETLKRRNIDLERAQQELEARNQRLAVEAEAERARVAVLGERLEQSQRENALRYRYDRIIGNSPAMIDALRLVDRVTDTESTVLVYGESGTGKELVARAIHYNGPRARGPFVSINCGALPETLLEATLFGHRKGSFTGAIDSRVGLFEEANGGTLFLDEVGDMSPTMQVRLLRALQEGEIRPVGGEKSVQVDVRIVAATHRNLRAEVEKGTFRQDLLYRLEVIVVQLPPLRERPEDIPSLATHLLAEAAAREDAQPPQLSRGALELLLTHSWPGNVRELASVLETARVLSDGGVIQAADLASTSAFRALAASGAAAAGTTQPGEFRDLVQAFERKVLADALARADGNMSRAARELGMDRAQMFRLLKRYGIGKSPGTTRDSSSRNERDESVVWLDDQRARREKSR